MPRRTLRHWPPPALPRALSRGEMETGRLSLARPPRARRTALLVALAALAAVSCKRAVAGQPLISTVHPDFASVSPHILTGEDFDPKKTEVWTWDPPSSPGDIAAGAEKLGGPGPLPPAEPPKGARRVPVLDVEPQVIVAPLRGTVVWVKTAGGCSPPYVFNVAKPFWVSDERAEQGAVVYVFGFGIRGPGGRGHVRLHKPGRTVRPRPTGCARSYRVPDRRLVHFELPLDTPPGRYDVYVHNDRGGRYGWRKAGDLEVVPRRVAPERVFDVRGFGARGDDGANDYEAITKAIEAAQKAGGGVVFFPPGTYRSDTTIYVPGGVTLRGASRENTLIEGYGTPPPHRRTTALIRPASHTRLESLTFQGATYKGPGDYGSALVCAPPPGKGKLVEDVVVRDCRLYGREVEASKPRGGYRTALAFAPCRNIRILGNDIYGAASLGAWFTGVYRAEIIGNTFHGGVSRDIVTLTANGFDCLVDANRLVDTPGRFLFNPRRHCYIRYNEVHQAFRATWTNAEEIYLVHGDTPWKTLGVATGGSPTTLVDTRQHWEPGKHRDAQVLILSGRGFGQHRTVVANTADTLRLERPWRVAPDATSQYLVGPMFVENAWFANLNNTPGRMSLWHECIGNVIEMHRDSYSRGIDIWGSDRSDRTAKSKDKKRVHLLPSWFNLITNCWMDGAMCHLWCGAKASNVHLAPPMFGNIIARNRITRPHAARTGFGWFNPLGLGGIRVGNRSGKDMTKPQDARVGLSHTIVTGNTIAYTNTGIAISDYARKTFLLDNTFQQVDRPILDWGARTVLRGNRVFSFDATGEHTGRLPDRVGQREIRPKRPPH